MADSPAHRPEGVRLSRALWLLFSLFIVYGTTIPFHFTSDVSFAAQKLSRIPWNPLRSADTGGRVSIPDAVQNMLLFVPFGVFGILSGRRNRATVGRIVLITLLGATLSLAVEAFQLFTLDRTTSTSDFAFDTIGAFLGAVAADGIRRASMVTLRALNGVGALDRRAFYPLMIATVVICAAAWEPFDITLDVSTVALRVRALQRDLWQFNGLTDEGVAFLHYALFAAAACAWLHRLNTWRAVSVTIAVGVPLAFALEACQFGISSRAPGLEDALVRAAGVVTGAALWSVDPRGRARVGWLALIVVATAAAAAVQMLGPFEIAAVRNPFQWLPFMNYYEMTTFVTLSHALELMLIYFPLGFCFGLTLKKPGWAIGFIVVLIVAAIAVPVEYYQGWIVGRFPDVTDPSLSVVGGVFGVWAAMRGAALFERTVASMGVSRAD